LLIYGSHERDFSNACMTQQGQGIYLVGRGTSSGALRFSEGLPLVHRRITGNIQGGPWFASGSPWGAKGEHPWIVCLQKTVKNPPRYGRRGPYYVDEHHRLMDVDVNQNKLNNYRKRSGVYRFAPGLSLGEPDSVHDDVYLGPWASEAIQFEC